MNRKGFTLIEMLVVIAIIGLLSSVVVIGLSGARSKARDAKRIADIRQIQNGLEVAYTAVNGYPASVSGNEPRGSQDPQGNDYKYSTTPTTPPRVSYRLGINLEGSDQATSVIADCPAGVTTGGTNNYFCVTPN